MQRPLLVFFFQAEDGIRDFHVTGVQTCALPISRPGAASAYEFELRARTIGQASDLLGVRFSTADLVLARRRFTQTVALDVWDLGRRSEEHTSELQSRENLVCRLLLEKRNETIIV